MSRKHFIKLAEAISQISNVQERCDTAKLIASVCAACNPNFSPSRFYAACNVTP
jgi:hypothetical protein